MSLKNINKQFGNTVKKYRETRGLTQEEFSELCNISRAYYGRIERGEHSVTIETCFKISEALAIPIALLFEEIV